MRRWMHTCYTLVTSEESQTLILKSLSSLGLLHSLALQRCFSGEQMSKRPLKEVEGMYLYTPQTNLTVTYRISKTHTDRTRWSTWLDAPVKCNGRKPKVSTEWPDVPVRDDRTCPIMQEPNWTLTWRLTASDHRWPDASGQLRTLLEHDRTHPITSQSRPIMQLPFETHVRLTTMSGPLKDRVRSIS
jgi:hypothetical protein